MAAEVKPRSNRMLIVLGVVLMLVAFFAVLYVNPGRGGGGGGQNISVVETAVDVPVGTQIAEPMLAVVQLPSNEVPTGYYTSKNCGGNKGGGCSDPLNQFAALALPKNTVLTQSNLVASVSALPPVKKPYLDIPTGQVAVQVPAGGELQAAGGFIQPDDRVDIIATGLPGMKTGTWKMIFQDLVINHIGGVGAANTQGLSSSYTLFVTPQEAEELTYFFANSTYKLLLRSQKDAKPDDRLAPASNDAGVSTDSFNSKYAVPK